MVCARGRPWETLCKTTTKPTKAYCGKEACADRISQKTGKPMQTIPGVQQAKKKVRNMQLLEDVDAAAAQKKSMQKRKSQQKKPQQLSRASRANRGKRKPRLIQTIQASKLGGGDDPRLFHPAVMRRSKSDADFGGDIPVGDDPAGK